MERPNILIILTDQQNFRMMSCTGNRWVRTPAMDELASRGVRFDRAYCTSPMCIPSRFSLFTGRMPSEIGLVSNEVADLDEVPGHILTHGMGYLARSAGYEAAYAGKVHLPRMDAVSLGFEYFCDDERDECAKACAAFVAGGREKPFVLVASLINPHDICYMSIRDSLQTPQERRLVDTGQTEISTLELAIKRPAGVSEEAFWREWCPPLPENYEIQNDEAQAIEDLLNHRPFRRNARDNWDDQTWRMHRWAYRRLTEIVDEQIGQILASLDAGPNAGNTVIIFTSDHGDHDSSHRLEHKDFPYDEAARVPMIIVDPRGPRRGETDARLVSNGMDLLPTVCDYMGVSPPDDVAGRSLLPLMRSAGQRGWRAFVPVETQVGNAVVSDGHKYVLYHPGANREQLYDRQADPFETRSFAAEPGYAGVLAKHREFYRAQWPQ